MPVLEDALLGAALIFTPMLLGLRLGKPLLTALSQALQRVPRTHYLVDILLDWLRRDPDASRAVLEGILYAGAAPPPEERQRIEQPALVIGHPNDPLHPFSDAGMLVEEMPNARLVDANSIFEWRVTPARLNDELARFLDEVFAEAQQRERRPGERRRRSRRLGPQTRHPLPWRARWRPARRRRLASAPRGSRPSGARRPARGSA